MKDLKKWKVLNSTIVFNHRWCKVRQDEIELPNGGVIDDYFVNIRPEIALILPVTNQQEVILVRQYRHGAGEILLELPAGTFNPIEESARAAALRELKVRYYVSFRVERIKFRSLRSCFCCSITSSLFKCRH